MSSKTINWFEIPVSNMQRAINFYENTLSITFSIMVMEGLKLAMFPAGDEQTGGALVEGAGYIPSKEGSIVYLNADERMDDILARVTEAGGNVILNKMSIGEFGFVGRFEDSEGNTVALHSIT